MKEFLKMNTTDKTILASLLIFAISFVLHYFFNFSFFLYLSGFFLAVFIPGIALGRILERKKNFLERVLSAPVFTVFFFTPIYYGLTLLADKKINFPLAFISILIVYLCSFAISREKETGKEIIEKDYYKFIFFGLAVFILVHTITTLVYRFVPEIDGYAYIMNAEQNLSSGIFSAPYRPMFAIFVDFVSLVSHIPPYWLFKFGLIIIQFSGIYYLLEIIKIAGVKNNFTRYLILAGFASVPVINLEIDYTRANVIFILALLPFIYYLSRGLDGEKKYFFFSSIIATTGLLVHEFFIILFLINAFFIFRDVYQRLNLFKKTIFWSGSAGLLFIMFLHLEKFNFLTMPLQFTKEFIELAQAGLSWQWWFLGGYSNMDGFNLGWTGFQDTLNYYAYSLSPFLFLILLLYFFVLIKKIRYEKKLSSVEKISVSILFVGLFFAEVLPRINFKTLPDRFWPMITMSLIILTPFVLAKFNFLEKKIFRTLGVILVGVGIGGSVYIAKAKAGYVSQREYIAAQWIKKNTPVNALFITQGGNGAMLEYFAKRKSFAPPPSFFLTQNNFVEKLESKEILTKVNKIFSVSLKNPTEENLARLNALLKKYSRKKKEEEKAEDKSQSGENIYVVYSHDKFNNYYFHRQWWRDINFYEADLKKFEKGYELIYNDSDLIYVWKKIN